MIPAQPDVIDRVAALLQQFGLELAFVDPVSESGLAGVTMLLGQLEDSLGEADDVPQPIIMGMIAIRRWVDDRLAADGQLTADTIVRLHQWQPWMVEAVTAWSRGLAPQVVPAIWSKAVSSSVWGGAADDGPAEVPLTPSLPAVVPPPPPHQPPAPLQVKVLSAQSPAEAAEPPPAVPAAMWVASDECQDDQQVAVLPEQGDPEMLQLFCAEAHDLLHEIEQGILVLEGNPTDKPSLDALFRAFHTFKGNVGVIKLTTLQQFTHEMESLLDAARKGRLMLGRASIGLILEGADVLERYVTELAEQLAGNLPGRTIGLPIPRLISQANALLAGRTLPTAPCPTPAPPPEVQPSRADSPPPSSLVNEPPPAHPNLGSVAVGPAAAVATSPSVPRPPTKPAAATPAGVVRVDTLKLDGLIDLVGELVIAQSMVVQNPVLAAIADAHLSRSLGQLRTITSDLQKTAMALRMVPVRATFQKMSRLVRDLAVQQGKEIQLVLEGEETELDRGLVEELGDPLVHMIRNSADHGIEPPDVRAAAGKPRQGTIRLRAFHQGGFIVIEIADDGRGLDSGRILAKAIERGLVTRDENLDRRQIHDLIFAPGFSTAEKITDISGRGVGMDVVRRNIERLRGKIEIDAEPGRGTTFTIYLPLTLAIIEGVLVGVGEERFVVPTLSVRESFRPLPGMVTTVQGKGEVVSVRGRLTPLLRLGNHFRIPCRAHNPTEGIVVVIESGQDARCVFVDELIGKQEVVIKSLGDLFRNQNDFAGAAILGDGRVGLILDVNALVKLRHRGGDAAA
ncbi:MAG: chemotaxis protein CheA [Planctomycetota bacterium]|nr:MAG: chemotaxis protein CheA [Planctomycetota bacterium]